MIILYHLVYQFLQPIYSYIIKGNASNNVKKSFEEKSEVTDNFTPNKFGDMEFVLRFDPPVYCQRYSAVQEILINAKWRGTIKKIVDYGCADFGLFPYVKRVIGLQEVLFVDVDINTLDSFITRLYPLNADYLRRRREPLNITVLNGSIANPSLEVMDVDAVLCIEIIEHLYPDTLDAMPYNIFGIIKPRIAIFTTPNADFNVLFPNFSGFRHWDHKFEWTRAEFEDWAHNIVSRYPDYTVYFQGIGSGPNGTEKYGECSQMAVFLKSDISLNNNLEIEYKNFFSTNANPNNQETDNSIDYCKFCEYEQNYEYDFISYGVCTYFTYADYNNNENERNYHCIHSNLSYKEIGTVEYPVDIDNRTQEERILHDILYKMFRFGSHNGFYYNEDLDLAEIPLYELLYTSFDEMLSMEDVRNTLENAGYQIKDCDIRGQLIPCVLYMPNDTMSKSSNRTKSSENPEQKDDYHSQTDEENWDVTSEVASELTSESLPPQNNIEVLQEKKTDYGESSSSPAKIECLYNSGCPLSSSSIEMVTPELIRSMQIGRIERKSDAIKAKSEQENIKSPKNQLKRQTMNNPMLRLTVMKSDGNIKLQKSTIINENMPNSLEEIEELNGENLSNEDLVSALNIIEEDNPNLETVSQEALYDANSENNISDMDLITADQSMHYQELFNPIRTGVSPVQVVTTDENTDPSAFPAWLLHLLHVSDADADSAIESEPHFYSQGDGLGIHPSISELSTDSSQSDVTVQLPDIVNPRISNFLERIDVAAGSSNDNSEDYFSIDEDTYVMETVNMSVESNPTYIVRELPLDLPVIATQPLVQSEVSTEKPEDTDNSKSTSPEQSTSKKKD